MLYLPLFCVNSTAHQSLLPHLWSWLLVTSAGTWAAWGGEGSELFKQEVYGVLKIPRSKPGCSAFEEDSTEPSLVLNKHCCSESSSAACLSPILCFLLVFQATVLILLQIKQLTISHIFANDLLKVLVTQSCTTLRDPMNCTSPEFHGILQERILELVAISFSRSSQPKDQTRVSYISGRYFNIWVTNDLLLAVYLIFILDDRNNFRQKANLSYLLIWVQNGL